MANQGARPNKSSEDDPKLTQPACAADSSYQDQSSLISSQPVEDGAADVLNGSCASIAAIAPTSSLLRAINSDDGNLLTSSVGIPGMAIHVSSEAIDCAIRSRGRGRGGRGRGTRGRPKKQVVGSTESQPLSLARPTSTRGRGRGRGFGFQGRKCISSADPRSMAAQMFRNTIPIDDGDGLLLLNSCFESSVGYGLQSSFTDGTILGCCSSLVERSQDGEARLASTGFTPPAGGLVEGSSSASASYLVSNTNAFAGAPSSAQSSYGSSSSSNQALIGQSCYVSERAQHALNFVDWSVTRHDPDEDAVDMHDPDYGWLHHGSMFLNQRVLIRLEREPGEMECLQEGIITKWRPRNVFSDEDMHVRFPVSNHTLVSSFRACLIVFHGNSPIPSEVFAWFLKYEYTKKKAECEHGVPTATLERL
jgi:hypothetical protein